MEAVRAEVPEPVVLGKPLLRGWIHTWAVGVAAVAVAVLVVFGRKRLA
ncbi:hypothetical protein [Amycolatopsis sp. NPDC003676]